MNNPYAPPATRVQITGGEPSSARAQVVGRLCAVCLKRIATAADGVACIACCRAYHAACLEDPDRCPSCGQSMSALDRSASEAEARATDAARRRGRRLVAAVIVPWLLFDVFSIATKVEQGAIALVMSSLGRLGIEVFLVWRAVHGTRWAQRLLAFFFGLGAAFAALAMAGTSAAGAVLMGVFGVCCAFGIWVFLFSGDARAYFESPTGRGH